MNDDLFLKSEEIHEALENLKGRANFTVLEYHDRFLEFEYLVNSYRSTMVEDYMEKVMLICESLTAGAGRASDTTILNASILVRGRKTTLGTLFEEAQKLLKPKTELG